MAAYIVCSILLTCGLASGLFVSIPEKISPATTKSVVLRCDPEVKTAIAILAINIKKKDGEAGLKSVPSETEGQAGAVGNPAESRQTQEEQTTPAPLGFPRLDSLQTNSRRKRSSEDEFVRAMITATNETDIVPRDDRFQVSGNIKSPPYLSVTIINPGVKDIGLFECEVTFLDNLATIKIASELTQIREVVEMTVVDLEQRVKQLEEDRRSNKESIQEMQKMVDSCMEANKFVQEDVTVLQKRTDDLFNTITELTKEVSLISATGSSGGADQKGHTSKRIENQGSQTEELFRLNARIDEIITNHLHALAKNLKELRDYERKTQERVSSLENIYSGSLDQRLKALEDFEWKGIKESLQEIELRTIPVLLMNVTDVHKNVTDIQGRLATCCGDVPQNVDTETAQQSSSSSSSVTTTLLESTPATTTPTEELITNYTVPACFVCGNNITEEHCPVTHRNKTSACPPNRPFCITDLYQDSMVRRIYKRCASEKECKEDKAKSSTECSTDDFRKPFAMECHFCCTSILCNADIRPPKDLY